MRLAENASLGLYLLGQKGLTVLETLLASLDRKQIAFVCIASDKAVENDYSLEIRALAASANINVIERAETTPSANLHLAVSWRWLIDTSEPLLVIHDSLLPKYRGFAPLVNMLIDGCPEIGATLLWATKEYDRGNMVARSARSVNHPIRIQDAIELVSECYADLSKTLAEHFQTGEIPDGTAQDETLASYSLWRDELDYFINWSSDSDRILRHIYASSSPYLGARTRVGKDTITILEAESLPDVDISNRIPGKVIFMDGNSPTIVCGAGLLKIKAMTMDGKPYTLPKFRSRLQ